MKNFFIKNKTLIVIAGVAICILLFVKIIGWNRITAIFDSDKIDQIETLKSQIKSDSLKISTLNVLLIQQKDSVERYQLLYDQSKNNYKIITKYYEKKIADVSDLSSKEAIEYFNSRTECTVNRIDTPVVTRLSRLFCANINFVEMDMYLAQRDTLQVMNETLESEVSSLKVVTVTQQEIIDTQQNSIEKYTGVITLHESVLQELQKEKKKTDRKLKRTKAVATITAVSSVVLLGVLILQ